MLDEHGHVEGCAADQHVVSGTGQLVREDAQRLAFAVLALQALQVALACGVLAQEQQGGLGEGPLEVGVADLLAGYGDRGAGRCV